MQSVGYVPFPVLCDILANVLTDGSSVLCFALHQFQIDQLIFTSELQLQHEEPAAARIFCAALCLDPWNSLDASSGCQVGNFNQVRCYAVLDPILCFLWPQTAVTNTTNLLD